MPTLFLLMPPRPNFLVTAGTILGILFILLAIMRFVAPIFPAITPYVVIAGLFLMILGPSVVHAILIRRRLNRDELDE